MDARVVECAAEAERMAMSICDDPIRKLVFCSGHFGFFSFSFLVSSLGGVWGGRSGKREERHGYVRSWEFR